MKVEGKKEEFKPVVITLETQDEVDQMYAVANFDPLGSLFDEGGFGKLWEKLKEFKSQGYQKWFDKINSSIRTRGC